MGDNQKVSLEPYIPVARDVFMRQRKSRREFIADTKKLRYLSLPPTNIQTLRIGESNLDPYLSYNK